MTVAGVPDRGDVKYNGYAKPKNLHTAITAGGVCIATVPQANVDHDLRVAYWKRGNPGATTTTIDKGST